MWCNLYTHFLFLPFLNSNTTFTLTSFTTILGQETNYPELRERMSTMIQTCNLVPRCILQHTSPHHLLPILLLLLRTWWGSCHPQCLDYKPPFEPRQPLAFCKEYSKFGCCDVEKDEEISGRFYNIMENFDHSGYAACGKYVRSILCQVRETFILIWFDLFDLMSIGTNIQIRLCYTCSV